MKSQRTIAVPDSIPDGVYELRIGVWDPDHRKTALARAVVAGEDDGNAPRSRARRGPAPVSPGRADDSFK